MRTALLWVGLVGMGWLGACAPLEAAAHTQADLLLPVTTAKPGQTFEVGVRLRMAPSWHTYWQNGGDSGMATSVQWDLPAGITAGAIAWPVPERYEESGLVTFVYHGEVVLLVPLSVAADCRPGPVRLKAKVSWLECSKACIPGDTEIEGSFQVGGESVESAVAADLTRWRARLPRPTGPDGLVARWEGPADTESRALVVEWKGRGEAALFFPLASDEYEVTGDLGRLPDQDELARLRKQVKRSGSGPWPAAIPGVLVERTAPEVLAYGVVLSPGGAGAGRPVPTVAAAGGVSGQSLGLMLGFAFLGGLILNVMPCVLPVIALKVLSFVRQAKEAPGVVRQHGLLYGAGVLVSFACLAGLVVAVQQAGRLASWGMHFQSPGFLLVMVTLVFLVALNLFGVFEVTLGGGTLSAAAGLASREGAAGAFFNGVLATTLATPCTAPYLGSAVGWAFAQPPLVILLLFLVIGAGLAAPYVLICFVPGLARFLPKPGLWMERFKVAMGFPMLGAGVWLLSLVARHYGTDGVLWVGLFLVCVAVAVWIWGQFVQRGRSRRGLAAACSVLILTAGYALALEGQLRWRQARSSDAASAAQVAREGGIPWEKWDLAKVEAAREGGRPVLVDFTADWCVTCQANKKTSIEIPSVAQKLASSGAAAFLGDYTLRDDAITRELKKYGRGGVPLVLVYPADKAKPPLVLPELLTPGLVLEALDAAAKR